MKFDEARELLPLYTANTLTPEQRAAVEDALNASDELRKELAFWRKARLTAQAYAEHAAQGHLSSEQIVDYAERAVSDPNLRSPIESHLQACKDCREEYDMILKTIPVAQASSSTLLRFVEKLNFVGASFKPLYAFTVVAVLIGVIFAWRYFSATEIADRTMIFVLPFQGEIRGQDNQNLPRVAINTSTKTIEFAVCIPHDSFVSTTYTATLNTPGGASVLLPGSHAKTISTVVDTLKLNIAAASLRLAGEYTLRIVEIPASLPPGSTPFPPEPYRFIVVR